jgi:hypothetical protein
LPELAFFQPILAEARNCPGVTPAIRWKLKKSGTPAAKPKHSGQGSESENRISARKAQESASSGKNSDAESC